MESSNLSSVCSRTPRRFKISRLPGARASAWRYVFSAVSYFPAFSSPRAFSSNTSTLLGVCEARTRLPVLPTKKANQNAAARQRTAWRRTEAGLGDKWTETVEYSRDDTGCLTSGELAKV